MTTQIVFNIDEKIKARAMKRAKEEGVPFSSVLKMAAKNFAEGKLSIDLIEEITPQKMRLLERQSRLMDQGKGTKLANMKEYRAFIRNL